MASRITPLSLAVWAFATLLATAQEPIVLRDLSVLRNQQIAGFDNSSVQLASGRELGWDEILSARVAADQQANFDQNIAQMGLPLFRMKYRVSLGDWVGAGELAEPLYRNLVWNGLTAEGDPKSNYMICVATMKSRLQTGQRAAAVVPFLQAAKIQQTIRDGVPGFQLLPTADAESLVSAEILPIWFDQEDAEIAFNQLANSFVPTSATQEVGAIVYLTALAIKVKRFSLAKELLLLIESKGESWSGWRIVLTAELEIEQGNPSGATQTIDQAQASLHGAPAIVGIYLRNAMLFF